VHLDKEMYQVAHEEGMMEEKKETRNEENAKSAFVQAGGALLATALRDPADIVRGSTLWDFTQLTEVFCTHLSESERTGQPYQQLVASIQAIAEPMSTDLTPVEGGYHLGTTVLEAFAVYG